jgi:protein TonB
MSISDKNSINGIFISLSLHLVVAGAFFYVSGSKSVLKEEPPKLLSISLSSFELPVAQIAQESQLPKKIVQKQEVKKVVSKPIEKNIEKTTIQSKTTQSIVPVHEAPVQETLKSTHETLVQESTQEKFEVEKETMSDNVAQSIELSQEEYAKTNFQSIRDMVLVNLKYPHAAKRMGLQGMAEVLLTIDTNGKLLHVTLQKSSGHDVLDKSALSAAGKLCSKALPTPQKVSMVTLPIYFALN